MNYWVEGGSPTSKVVEEIAWFTLKERRKNIIPVRGLYGTKRGDRRYEEMNGQRRTLPCVFLFVNTLPKKPTINIFVIYDTPWNSWYEIPVSFPFIDFSLCAPVQSEFPVLFHVFEASPYSRWGHWSSESLAGFFMPSLCVQEFLSLW